MRFDGDENFAGPFRRSYIELKLNKEIFGRNDTAIVNVDVDPIAIRFYPFVRIRRSTGRYSYLTPEGKLSAKPMPCIAGGPFVTARSLNDFHLGTLRFKKAAPGTYTIESGAVDAATFPGRKPAYLGNVSSRVVVVR
jgi:hypothetical protein